MKRQLHVYILMLLPVLFAFAQESHYLTLDECLKITREKSYDIRLLKEEYAIARANLSAATNRFKTQVNLNFNFPDYTETISSITDSTGTSYFPLKQSVYSTDLTISQPLPTDGSLFIQSGIFHVQDFSNENNAFRLNTRIGFEQPLEAIYSYNNILSAFKMAELNFELTSRRYTRTLLDLNYQTSSAFYSYLNAIELQKIAQQTLQQQQESNTLAQNKYKAGVIAEVEALQMEVDLAEAKNNFDIARANTASRANNLKQLLRIPLTDSLIIEADLSFKAVEISLEKALEYGLQNRLEIREREINREQAELNIERTRLNGQIRGKISAYYDLIGYRQEEDTVPLSTTFDNALRELRRRPGNRGVALQVSIPLWDWGVNKAEVAAANARLRQSRLTEDEEKVNVEKDIRNTVNNIKSSLNRLEILEKNIAIAERSFMISKNRFANGEINSQSLALDRNRLQQAYQSRLSALIAYKLLLEDITRKTFYDFVDDREVQTSEFH